MVWLRLMFLALLCIGGCSYANAQYNDGDNFDYDASKPMVFMPATNLGNCNGCEWIAAEGVFTEETPELLLKFLKARSIDYVATFHFNSPGGNLVSALKVGEIIRQHNFHTSVGKTVGKIRAPADDRLYVQETDFESSKQGVCASACVYAFLGGATRFATKAKVGVHQFHDRDAYADPLAKTANAFARSADQLLNGILLEYTIRMGASPALIALASSIPPWKDMRWLTDEELIRLGIDNADTTFTPLSIEPLGQKGSYVETISHSVYYQFRHRIYCKGSARTPYVSVFGAAAQAEILRRIASLAFIELTLSDGTKKRFQTGNAAFHVAPIDKGDTASFDLGVAGATMEDFRRATRVSFEGNFDRPTGDIAYWLSFNLEGDRRKIGIVARSCVD